MPRRAGGALAEGAYCRGPMSAGFEAADMEFKRAKGAFGGLRRRHVADIDAIEGGMPVATWDRGK